MIYPTLSIYDLYEYDNTIFDNFALPAGVDKDSLIGNLTIELAGLEVLYTNPHFLKKAIKLWSEARLDSWKRIFESLIAEYNPLHNYDRHETFTDTENSQNQRNTTRLTSVTRTDSTSGNSTVTVGETSVDSVAAYDSETLVENGKNVSNSSINTLNSVTSNGSDSENGTEGVTDNGSTTSQHTSHIYGNVGVTTSTQMLVSEIDARAKFDFDSIVIREFKKRFCLMVY